MLGKEHGEVRASVIVIYKTGKRGMMEESGGGGAMR